MSASQWQTTTVGKICTFSYGKSLPASSRTDGPVDVFGSNGAVGRHNHPLTSGPTIIIGRKGSVGEVHYSAAACWPIDTTYFVEAKSTECDLRWLYWLLASLGLTDMNRAAAVPGLNRDDAYRLPVLLPPLDEQRRIADVLDRADNLVAHCTQGPSVSELKDSLMRRTLGPFHSIEMVELGSRLSFVTSGGRGWARYYSATGKPFVRSYDVKMNKVDQESMVLVDPPNNAEARRTEVRTGDVLLTITGSKIGRVAPVPESLSGGFVSQHVAILRPNDALNAVFLSHYLSLSDGGQRQISRLQYGQTKPGLNFDQIRGMRIPQVSIQAQNSFAAAAGQLDTVERTYSTRLACAIELFSSLQYRAFRGEL